MQRPGFEQRFFRPLARGHVFHSQHQQLPVMARLKLAGVEQHHAAPDDREGVLQLEVVEDGTRRNDVFEECPQGGNVPLAVAQFVNEVVLRLFGRDLKRLIEGAVGASDAQGGIQHQERLAHRIHDVLRVRFDVFNQRFSLHHRLLRSVLYHKWPLGLMQFILSPSDALRPDTVR